MSVRVYRNVTLIDYAVRSESQPNVFENLNVGPKYF